MNVMLFPVCLVAFCLFSINVVDGCSCYLGPNLCKDQNFLLYGEVQAMTEAVNPNRSYPYVSTDRQYFFKVLKRYRGSGVEGTTLRLTSSGSGSLCGVYLNVGERYVISDRPNDEGADMGLCSTYYREASEVFLADQQVALDKNRCPKILQNPNVPVAQPRDEINSGRSLGAESLIREALFGAGMKKNQQENKN